MSELIGKILENTKNPWIVSISKNARGDIDRAEFHNPKFGTLTFGLRPEGKENIGWMWKEVGEGGVGIIPYAVIEAKLFIGLISQERHTLGGASWNIPRGFFDPTKTHFESALQELSEETGYQNPGKRFCELKGEPANCNSTFFDTSSGGGFRYYGLEINPDQELERFHDFVDIGPDDLVTNIYPTYKFVKGIFKPTSTMGERITGCLFFPWEKAATVNDLFSNAIGRLLVTVPKLKSYL